MSVAICGRSCGRRSRVLRLSLRVLAWLCCVLVSGLPGEPRPAPGIGHRPHPRPRRRAPGAAGDRASSQRVRSRHRQPPDAAGPLALGRLSRNRAARRVRADRDAARGHGSAQRNVRPPRARDHDRDHRRFSEQRPHLPQRVLALEDASRSISGATRSAAPSRSGSTAPASCGCSARSTRT